ncbi:hypothetical protein AB0B31_10755 [Catellatospora citrea]|uniref:hypothetical protein n=1 Tax=Catellatospora citrea TaxID=53366 RepID=UPI0033CD6728
MGFFDGIQLEREPEPEFAPLPPAASWVKPELEVPASLAVDVVLARTEAAAVVLADIRVYSNGFEFLVCQFYRDAETPAAFGRRRRRWERGAELRVGIGYPDGRVAASPQSPPSPYEEANPGALVMAPREGGGGGRHYQTRYWVWPLPPPGAVTFVCDWAEVGIDESTANLDGEQITAASLRAVRLWPEA